MAAKNNDHRANVQPARWYCVRCKPKQERIAADALRCLTDVDVFCPRLRFQKLTRRGNIWFEEALFPGYLFAKFILTEMYKAVTYAHGVAGLVRFGTGFPTVPKADLAALRTQFADAETRIVSVMPEVGQPGTVLDGPFVGLAAVVSRVMPATQRVAVLFDFLGRQSEIELPTQAFATTQNIRALL